MKIIKNIVLPLLIVGLSFYAIVGCSDGGDSDDVSSGTVIQTKTIDINVTLPASSPISNDEVIVYIYGEGSQVDVDGLVKVTTVTGNVIDVSLMLPARENEDIPTVYLSSLVVPGETEVHLNSEETALSLVLENVSRVYLQDPEIAMYVKSLVRRESEDFIAYFKMSIEADPYLLHPDSITNVLGPEFLDTVLNVNTVLDDIFISDQTVTPSAVKSVIASSATSDIATPVSTSVVIKPYPEWTTGDFYLSALIENGQYTDDLNFWNRTWLPALYRVTDTATGEVLKEIPEGNITTVAFSEEIFGPKSTIFNIKLPSYEVVKSNMKNIQIEIYTPGLEKYDSSIYYEIGSPSEALFMRSVYSYALIPIFSDVLPFDAIAENTFSVLQEAGVFDELLPYWSSGNYIDGIGVIKSRLTVSLLKTVFTKLITDKVITDNVVSTVAKKIAAVLPTISSVAQLQIGLGSVPSKITYYVTYPITIEDIRPVAVKKVEETEASPEFILQGHGFRPFMFADEMRYPSIKLGVYDTADNKIFADVNLTYQNLDINEDGSEISFGLPTNIIKKDTNISYVRVQLQHSYVEIDWLVGDITDYYNTLKDIELPVTEGRIKEFTIYLSSDLLVSDTDLHWKETNESLLIYGEGFHSDPNLQNRVYFKDNSSASPIESIVYESDAKNISTRTPVSLALEHYSVGTTFLYVELEDGSRSNDYPLKIYPKPVSASVIGDITTPGLIYKGQKVILKQENSVPIFYSLNGSALQPYTDSIELTESSTLQARAILEINGTRYPSRSTSFEYKTCDPGLTYIPYPHGAQCVVIQNQHLIPTRYCPIHAGDFKGEITTNNFKVNCSYAAGDSGQIGGEVHYVFEDGLTREVAYVWYWTEPIGRPMYVRSGDEEHYLCPDGAIALPDIPCSH